MTRPMAIIGGVMRGPNGGWMGVESRTMLEGLKLAWAQGFRQVELESDNALLIDVIQNGDNNKVVDRITKETRGRMQQLIIYVDPLPYVRDLLEEDVQHAKHTMVDGE
ncbi:hypothetical protein J1N35_029351 [Gossypium stocksii]|uniref:RNase H type-1 domain-containing protein n=1 Tax=Gossypium stocksii TaxID=47602 RepID=A0A9D3UYK0_9ROSI|nr:hypothetical protein J1N35_029351 [Gossypium stocksii]